MADPRHAEVGLVPAGPSPTPRGPLQGWRAAGDRPQADDTPLSPQTPDASEGLPAPMGHPAPAPPERTALATVPPARRPPSGPANAWLARVAHELRMPLHAIVGHAQVLQGSSQPGTQLALAADFICSTGNSLLALATDLLDHCSLTNGDFTLRESEFPLERVLVGVDEVAGLAARTKGLRLRRHLAGALPARVVADEERLRHVLLNLLDNAINHTASTVVTLEVRGRMAGESTCILRFEVHDTELGVSREPHATASASPGPAHFRRHGGTGVGLMISRELLRAMHSELEVSNHGGRGTCFAFSLRVPVAVTGHPPAEDGTSATPHDEA